MNITKILTLCSAFVSMTFAADSAHTKGVTLESDGIVGSNVNDSNARTSTESSERKRHSNYENDSDDSDSCNRRRRRDFFFGVFGGPWPYALSVPSPYAVNGYGYLFDINGYPVYSPGYGFFGGYDDAGFGFGDYSRYGRYGGYGSYGYGNYGY